MKKTHLVLMFIITIAMINSIFAQDLDTQGYCGGMMSGFYGGYGSAFMILSWITAILLIVLICAAIYWLIKSANKKK